MAEHKRSLLVLRPNELRYLLLYEASCALLVQLCIFRNDKNDTQMMLKPTIQSVLKAYWSISITKGVVSNLQRDYQVTAC